MMDVEVDVELVRCVQVRSSGLGIPMQVKKGDIGLQGSSCTQPISDMK